ncbi:alpha/beta hydrolase family protein [Fulvivirga sediminis]|uniref:Platelet-activating factor acetylhydrolase n=1 Tax=Fulvivirga sediminis TaxID=2803949 RepID=A0A937F9H1_9BACT|nr:hypothetical protein [Fulvivirga sediminis]MBL3658776.1 hypothetical protein [Fulvivirga sediminis]
MALGCLLLVHLMLEGYRWQMIPAYILIIILSWRIKVIDLTNTHERSFLKISGFLGLFVLLIAGWTLPLVLPVFSFPTPRGKYSVGTTTTYVQTDMDEIITEDANDKRELSYKIWYPSKTDVSNRNGEKYLNYGERSGFAVKYGLPPNALNYLDLVETYAYADIPMAKGPFPVLIFSHGYGSQPSGYYALLTEIASHGYVIINMNHTYEGLGATFPDGAIKYFDYDFQAKQEAGTWEAMQPLVNAMDSNFNFEERHKIVREPVRNYWFGKMQDRWATDMIYTIDLLEQWNSSGMLKSKLDVENLGVFGHSAGGGSAGQVALRDNRIKAAANLDGNQWGQMIDTLFHVPFLHVTADWPEPHINSHIYANKGTDYFYDCKILKAGHPNFMDIPFLIPVNEISQCGEIEPYTGMEIITNLIIAFFDKHLKKKKGADPQKIYEQYELLEMTVIKGDSLH